jgi:hypothetical protein
MRTGTGLRLRASNRLHPVSTRPPPTMNEKLPAVALVLVAVVAVTAGGVAALDVSAPGPDAQHDEHPTADGYEFVAVADHDDWLADRDADASTVAERLLDGETGAAVREQFDAGEPLAVDVYGDLQPDDADSAHVVVTQAPVLADSNVSEQEPRVEATVDLGEDGASLVGVSTPSDGVDADVRNASEVNASLDLAAENATGDAFTVTASDDAAVLSAGDMTTVTVDEENVTLVERNGDASDGT